MALTVSWEGAATVAKVEYTSSDFVPPVHQSNTQGMVLSVYKILYFCFQVFHLMRARLRFCLGFRRLFI